MEKKREVFKYIFLLSLIISFIIQIFYIVSLELTLTLMQKVILVTIQFLSIIGYVHFQTIHKIPETRRKALRMTHWILFVMYCFNLIYILFFDPDFGRRIIDQGTSFRNYIDYNVNLDLFETIHLYIRGYQNEVVSLEALLRNIFGNMVIFMPMAYFLQVFFKCQRKFVVFFVTIFLMVLGVEIIQVLFRIGSGDIDDLFLNVFGCILMYLFLKCLPLHKIYDQIGGQ